MDAFRRDVGDFGFRVQAESYDSGLCAGERRGFRAESLQCHRQQGNGGLLAGGEQDVHLAFRRLGVHFLGQFD